MSLSVFVGKEKFLKSNRSPSTASSLSGINYRASNRASMEIYLRRRLNKKVWSTTLSLTVEGLRKFEKVSFRKLTAIQYTCPRKPIHPTCPSTVTINLSLLPQLSAINSATIPYAPIPAITHRGAVAIRNLPSNKKERKRERKERNVGRIIPWTKLGARFRGIVRGMDPLEGES